MWNIKTYKWQGKKYYLSTLAFDYLVRYKGLILGNWKANYLQRKRGGKQPQTSHKPHEDTIPTTAKLKTSNNFYICHEQWYL